MKLYWRVKINGRWTYKAAKVYQRQFSKGAFTLCVKDEYGMLKK